MSDWAVILLIVGVGCLLLFAGGLAADAWEEHQRREDAWHRNHRGR